ncbi:MAG: hypothetical protein H7227_03930 [Actinobacteria bacterium]|nr:hypothetical protein [Actinomycetota bacterium]
MRKELLIAAGTTFGVGISVVLSQTLFENPQVLSSQSNSRLLATNSGNVYTGPSINVSYGRVRVEITVVDGIMTDVRALEFPTGRSERYSKYSIPALRQQTLTAQSADIQGSSGASFTSYGWKTSLQAAMKSAKL